MSDIDDVKQRLDIVEVIGQYVTLSKAGRNFKAPCPFHTEKTPSFFVFPERQSWHCFGACGTGGDVFSFVMKQQGIEFGDALRLLAEQAGVTISSRGDGDTRKDEKERLLLANDAAAQFYHDSLLNSPTASQARDYLTGRGFTPESAITFKLGYSPGGDTLQRHLLERGYTEPELLDAGLILEADDGRTRDRFWNRLMFPIRDPRGRTTGFGARVLDSSLPKYTNSPQTLIFDKSGTIYGLDLAAAAIRKQDLAVLVEGYMDVITAHQHGFSNVVASMGTSITERQVTALKRLTRNIALALDADAAGQEAMLRCVDYENLLDAEVRAIILPAGKDPDNVIREDSQSWQALVEGAVPVIDYAITTTTDRLDLTTAGGKSLAASELLPVIGRVKDPVRRDHYLTRLANLAGIRYNVLETTLRGQTVAPAPRKQKGESGATPAAPLLSSPVEEYCLSLLLQYPELKDSSEGPLPQHFQNSQNREIFLAWQHSADLHSLHDRLDSTLSEQVDALTSRNLLGNQMEQKYADCVMRLRKEFLQGLKGKRADTLPEEAQDGISSAAQLTEEDIEVNDQLLDVFTQERRTNRSTTRDDSGRVS